MVISFDQDLVSIIIPIFNVEPYVRDCLDSILSQTYQNLEIIIVASDSGDKSVQICEEYSERDNRIRVIHRKPLGLSDAKNVGIENSNGSYIGFVDGDDFVSDIFVEKLHSLCAENGCEIAQCEFKIIDGSISSIDKDRSNEIEIFSNIDMCMNLYNELYVPTVVSWSKLYRRELFTGVRFPEGRIHEDEATTHRLLFKANRIVVIKSRLYFYRKVASSIMGVSYNLKRLDYFQALDERLDFFLKTEQPVLHSLTRERYLKKLIENRKLIRKHIPDNKELERSLGQKIKIMFPLVIRDSNIRLKNKVMILGFLLFPGTALTILRFRGLY